MKNEINQTLKKNGVEPFRVYFDNVASGKTLKFISILMPTEKS